MPVQHVNRRGHTYYLHQHTTRDGAPGYHFSLQSQGHLADAVPDGYEVYEHPNGQVFLRKVRPQVITSDEIRQVEREINRHPRLRNCRVDVRDRTITVFVPSQEGELLAELWSIARERSKNDIAAIVGRNLTLSPELRFVLADEERRVFAAQRYCYLGSIDDWIYIGEPGRLRDLAREYVRHLGKESYFDLF